MTGVGDVPGSCPATAARSVCFLCRSALQYPQQETRGFAANMRGTRTLRMLLMLYPNWLSIGYFTQNWKLFFKEEVKNFILLFGLVLLWHFLVAGFTLFGVATHIALAVLFRRVLAGGLCTSTKRLSGQTVIVTGANCGIGKETARDMLRRGARVILACRDLKKAEAAKQDLRGEGGTVEVRKLDLSSLQSIRDFADRIIRDNDQVHILVNNAGIALCPYMETQDGFEMQMGTNHLGHFLLTNLLLPQMKHGEPARIINVSSCKHLIGFINLENLAGKDGYDRMAAYDNSKLANVLFTRQLARILRGSNIQVFSLHPGGVFTEINRHCWSYAISDHLMSLMWKTPMEGAQTTIHCATEAEQHEEMYFSDCAVGWACSDAKDDVLAEKLWKLSAELVGLDQ